MASPTVAARGCRTMLLRLAYLGVTNTLAMLRLLPMSDRTRDAEILALRHQITILERQLHGEKVRFSPADRTLLAALLHALPHDVLRQIRLLVRPETVLCWHRDLIAARHARLSCPKRAGRPPTIRSIPVLVLRLARRTAHGGTGASTVSCSCLVSRSVHRRCGRSCTMPASIPRPSEPQMAGRCSCNAAPVDRRAPPRQRHSRAWRGPGRSVVGMGGPAVAAGEHAGGSAIP